MILVDTSVWIDHLRVGDARLRACLEGGRVMIHPFVIGELALGVLSRRAAILGDLRNLPPAAVASDDEVMHFIEENRVWGAGVGYIDAHLLAATRLTPGATLWTRDRRLGEVAARLGLAYD